MPKRLRPLLLVMVVGLFASACGSDSQTAESSSVVAATAAGGQIDFGALEGLSLIHI